MPEISVIIPVYNVEKYLSQCLESVLNQTFKDIEIICIDDCSKDNSLKILKDYKSKDERIKVIELESNCRQGTARNAGLQTAKGKYISFVDADDWIDKDLLKKQYEKIVEYDVDFVLSGITNFLDENDCDEKLRLMYNHNEIYAKTNSLSSGKTNYDFRTSKDFNIGPVSKLFKKSIIDRHKISFPENCIEEDIAFHFLYMMQVKTLYYIEENLYNRRVHQSSTLYKLAIDKQNVTDKVAVMKFICKYLKKHKLYSAYKKKFLEYVEKALTGFKNSKNIIGVTGLISYSPIDILGSLINQKFIIPLKIIYTLHKNRNKKIAFWGASLFLEKFLENYNISNKNIIGIIDKNPTKVGKTIGNYIIFSPENINVTKPDAIIMTVMSNNETVYDSLKKELLTNHPDIELLNNMFK